MTIRVAINGFGRIGRLALRVALTNSTPMEIVAVNDLGKPDILAHLLKYDSIHGILPFPVDLKEHTMLVDSKEIQILAQKNPSDLPWKELGIDVVIESTGYYTDREGAGKHLAAGAKKVVISAPGKNEDITIVMGINENNYDPQKHHIISNASCTTNGLAPVVKVLLDEFGIEAGMMTTIHSVTNDQRILDLEHNDWRRSRAAFQSMIPTTSGAAKAVALVLPELKGKLTGLAVRVPTPDVSLVDFVANLSRKTTAEEVNSKLEAAAQGPLKGILGFSNLPLVSIDYKGNPVSAIVDGLSTMMLGEKMVKVLAWYDNEIGYSNRVIDLVSLIAAKGL
ncbi:MAG TPA: type I glyceraldehyde-3-phosphate dehydrogenase [Desulfitobacteriaceae bacterium]|nr:type I glyceraldehyde-3-phosphate dehydrogenase [Desulfitobacteriaceae bacterium]